MDLDGKYEIVEMELWDKEDIDLTEPGYFSIKGRTGSFHFICVDGDMDIKKKKDKYVFSWEGSDECDPVSGHGEFVYLNDVLTGRIYFYEGDDSSFTAIKIKS